MRPSVQAEERLRKQGRAITTLWCVLMVAGGAASQAAEEPFPGTLKGWFSREHRFLQRYLAVVNQTAHDYSYDYKTPTLLLPIAIDLFTGYVAVIHEAEERVIYPALQEHADPEQQRGVQLILTGQREESDSVKSWQQVVEFYGRGQRKAADIVEPIDYLGRMINRHIVLQEKWLFPLLGQVSPKGQATLLKRLRAFEDDRLGAGGRARYEQLLAYIEEQIKGIAGRVW